MRLADIPFLQSVDERDIDFVLLEEFHSEPEFVHWFVRKVGGNPASDIEFIGAWHSISDPTLGESDVTLVVAADGIRMGILIENKVDAPAQPDQAGRYFARGDVSQLAGEWERCVSCIVAPVKYLEKDREAAKYNARVSYEEVHEWLRANTPDSKRRQFRLNVIAAAIEQNRRGRAKHSDERVAAFFRDYWQFAQQEFPELQMRKNEDAAANNTWPEFVPAHLKEKHRATSLIHKLNSDCVDLQFGGLQSILPKLIETNRELLVDGVKFVPRGDKAAALTITAPAMVVTEPFAAQISQAREALKAAYKLSVLLRAVQLD